MDVEKNNEENGSWKSAFGLLFALAFLFGLGYNVGSTPQWPAETGTPICNLPSLEQARFIDDLHPDFKDPVWIQTEDGIFVYLPQVDEVYRPTEGDEAIPFCMKE